MLESLLQRISQRTSRAVAVTRHRQVVNGTRHGEPSRVARMFVERPQRQPVTVAGVDTRTGSRFTVWPVGC
jgi:hypothetical protein